MRILIILVGFSILSCNSTDSKAKNGREEIKEENKGERIKMEPNYHVGVQFINDYIDFLNDPNPELTTLQWVERREDVSISFKAQLRDLITDASDNDAPFESNPILDAQDYPEKFEIAKKEDTYLIVKGVDWPDLKLTLKLKNEDDNWQVDGSGIINIPKNRRMKR